MARILFSTVVSQKYIYKFMIMYQSLKHHYDNFHMYVLCLDGWSSRVLSLLNYKEITLLGLENIEDDVLRGVKNQRLFHEYAWTVKPAVLDFVMRNFPETQYYAHVDADLCFFSSPADIFNENPHAKFFLTKHHYSHRFSKHTDGGVYNTGFVGCSSKDETCKAVQWWREKCIEDCPLSINREKQIYGDQRYVEHWENLFGDVHEIKSKGVNTAVWNIDNYSVYLRDGEVFIDDDKLIFYHFSHFSILDKRSFNLTNFHRLSDQVVQSIYMPYMILMSQSIEKVSQICPEFRGGYSTHYKRPGNHYFELKNG